MMEGRRLHVHHLITKLELGGAQQNTLYCVRHHDRKRFSVSLGAGIGGVLDGDAKSIPGADIHWFPDLVREVSPARDIPFLMKYTRFLVKNRVDILHTHSSKAGILGRIAAAFARIPVVVHTVHGWGFHDYQRMPVRKFYVLLERLIAPHTDILIGVSRENIERGLREGIGHATQYRLIHSGINVAEFSRPSRPRAATRKGLGIPAGALVVGTVGNFKAQKAPLDFIRAAALVQKSVPNAWFVMAGDGELLKEARDLAENLGIGGRVVFAGWRRDIPDLLAAFDLFALSSLFEGLPRSVLQAHSAGLPIVATDAGGTAEAVRDGVTGYVTRPRDPAGLSARIISILKDPAKARAMGEAGRKSIGEDFEIGRMLADIEENYLAIARLKGLA
jgi:glycosyltransferase involved in cell wall biosynthesis